VRTATYEVCRQIDKVSIVFVDKLHHGTLKNLEIHVKVIPQHFQLNFTPTLDDKVFHMKVILKVHITLLMFYIRKNLFQLLFSYKKNNFNFISANIV